MVYRVKVGREEEFRYLQRWLAFSDRLDRLIEAGEEEGESQPVPVPLPITNAATEVPHGIRAAFAAPLVCLAIALHREAASPAGPRPETEGPR